MCEAIVVLVTCATGTEAEKIAYHLLEERLVACVNIWNGVRSLFHWKGAISKESESLLLMKTRPELFEELSRKVKELHSYEVPEIIALPVTAGNPDYLAWVCESTRAHK